MDQDTVLYTMGRPPRKTRESDNGTDYEEWIYGAPPADVLFIRFVGDKVVRIENMKVSGEKVVRTQDEMAEYGLNASAKPAPAKSAEDEEPLRAPPSLVRPGEQAPETTNSDRDPNPHPLTPDTSTPPPEPN
jgi:hypothetical protein